MKTEIFLMFQIFDTTWYLQALLVGLPVPDQLLVVELDRPDAIRDLQDDAVEDAPKEVTVLSDAAAAGLGNDLLNLHAADAFTGRRHHVAVAATAPKSM